MNIRLQMRYMGYEYLGNSPRLQVLHASTESNYTPIGTQCYP